MESIAMGKRKILCGVCSKELGTQEARHIIDDGQKHESLLCGNENDGCARLFHKFRADVDSLNVQGASLARDLLTMRGATALWLHLKILATDEREAQKLSALGADFNEAIKGEASKEQLIALGVK